MNLESNLSGHWTDEQLLEHLYGIGPEGQHLEECAGCRERLSAMLAARRSIESESAPVDQVPFDLLAAQRRRIYSRLSRGSSRVLVVPTGRWVALAATFVLLGGGALVYEQKQEQNQQHQAAHQTAAKVSDAQLAQEVSRLAQDSEPSPTAPLEGLFDQ